MNCRKMFQIGRLASVLLALVLGLTRTEAVPSADGLYATFFIKRNGATLGEFTCSLNYQLAPRTVANFVGLATGSRGWMDFKKGGVSHKPFYDGITFHRVVAGFVIQAGSPNGLGTDGPGYTFRDEFHASLRHYKAGILSMANSGLNSNGSQFFITLAATSHLDDVHSVFGEVVENLAIMQSVQQGDVIDHVTVTRVGAAAQAFDVDAHTLPAVQDALPSLVKNGSSFALNYTQADHAEYFVYHSPSLANFLRISGQEFYTSQPSQTPRDVTSYASGQSQHFFTVTKAQYSVAPAPESMTAKRITMTDRNWSALEWNLTGSSSGNFTLNQYTGRPVTSYTWTVATYPDVYRGHLIADISNSGLSYNGYPFVQADIELNFDTSTGGFYKGALILGSNQGGFLVIGTFSVTNLP